MSNIQGIGLLILLFILAGGLIIAFAKWAMGARRVDESGYEVVGGGGGMRRAIIRIGEFAAILFVISSTLLGAVFAGTYSYALFGVMGGGGDPRSSAVATALLGAAAGFLSAALATAPLFAVSAIEQNTRRTAAFLERLAQPRPRV